MRKLLQIAIVLFLAHSAFGQDLGHFQEWCQAGGQKVVLQGLQSITQVQASYPQCQVTVYFSGTTTKAIIYSDNTISPGVLTNPYVANIDGSFGFYADTVNIYDVTISGAGLPAPFTFSAVTLPSVNGGSSGGVSGNGIVSCLSRWTGSTVLSSSGLCDDLAGNLSYTSTNVNLTTSLIGGNAAISGAPNSSGNGGAGVINGGSSVSGGVGGPVLLVPGLGPTAGTNGAVAIGTGLTAQPFSLFTGVVVFASLGTPPNNPVLASPSRKGAILFCTDCSGPQDGASVGTVAIGGGSGTLVLYDGTNWRTVSGVGTGGGGGGSVTQVNPATGVGTLAPLAHFGFSNQTTTPLLTLTLDNAAAHKFFGNNTGSTAAPDYESIGTGDLPFTYSGNTTKLVTESGSITSGNCPQADASGNLVDSGAPCGGGGSNATSIQGNPVTSGTLTIPGTGYFLNPGATALIGQRKLIFDMRDYTSGGNMLDCTGNVDNSTLLNALGSTNNAMNAYAFVFPVGCVIGIANSWLVKNQSAFVIEGPSTAGANGINLAPTFKAIAGGNIATGSPMIDMEYVDGFVVQNIAINGNNIASTGINVDKTGSGGVVNTTDGIFRRLYVTGNDTGNKFIGIYFSLVSTSNVEDMRVLDSTFFCGTGATKGVAAIVIGASTNAKNERILHNDIHQCAIGVKQLTGGVDIEFNEFGNNSLDMQLSSWSDPNEVVKYNLGESSAIGQQFLVVPVAGAGGQPLDFGGNNIPINDVCAVDFSNARVTYSALNTFYVGGGGSTGTGVCNTATGGVNMGALTLSGSSLTAITSSAGVHKTTIEGFNSKDVSIPQWYSNITHKTLLSTGTGFQQNTVFYGSTDNQDGFAPSSSSTQNVSPCLTNTQCLNESSMEVTGIVTPTMYGCLGTGGTGTTYGFYISALDASGNETLLRGANPYQSCSGPATLNGTTNYLTVYGLGDPGATSCNLYMVNTANSLQVAVWNGSAWAGSGSSGISCTSAWTFQVNSVAGSFPIITPKSPYNKTLAYLFRGKEVDFQYGTPLKGYSDKGITLKWSIDSATGNAVLNNLTLNGTCSGSGCFPYPTAGIPISTGTAWASSLSETDGSMIAGVAGSWAKVTALPNGITATTQSAGDNSGKVATNSYVDSGLALKLNTNNSSPTGTFDGSALTQQKLPVAAAFLTLANGEIGYDTTNKGWHVWQNGADNLIGVFTGSLTNGHCAQIQVTGSVANIIDAGGACGTSSMVYPSGDGIPIVVGGASWGTTLSETDGQMLAGVSGAWTKVTALPNGITATTQTPASNDTKVATDAYVDAHFIASGTQALGTTLIPSATCATTINVSASGVATTDVPKLSFNSDPTSTVGFIPSTSGTLTIFAFPSLNTVNIRVCNYTASGITPGAVTLNWNVQR